VRNSKNFSTPKPILKPKISQLILAIQPQPPSEHRDPPNLEREKISRKNRKNREKLPLRESVDYSKLTPSERVKWDAGIYGSIHLKRDKGYEYYVVRWVDPRTGTYRSNALGKTLPEAKARLKQMVLGR
jgi:hypothetical protein